MNIPLFRFLGFFCLFLSFSSLGFSQEGIGPTEEEIQNNTQELILKVRQGIATNQYTEVFSLLSSELSENTPIVKSWFLYVMWAEVAKIKEKLSVVINLIPKNGPFLDFSKALSFWNSGDVLSSARILAPIASKDPSLEYLVGKLYLSIGKVYQGAGYLYLGANMQQAPYGLYYAGLGQNSVGKFSRANSFLSRADSMLIKEERGLSQKIQIQRAVADFGNENYDSAYNIILPIYETDPVVALEILDPGIILTAMKKNEEAREFWNGALKKSLPGSIVAQIRKNLSYNRKLIDPNYPPAWQRH